MAYLGAIQAEDFSRSRVARHKMRVASLVLCYLSRGLGFSPSVSPVIGINRFLSNRGIPPSSTEQQHHFSQPAPSAHGLRASANPTTMVLRPDWEREGRVFGLGMPSRKEGQRAFEYLVNYPCEFEIKVIGLNKGNFADDMAATVSAACQVSKILQTDVCKPT